MIRNISLVLNELSTVRIENAEASTVQGKENISKLIRDEIGFQQVNSRFIMNFCKNLMNVLLS